MINVINIMMIIMINMMINDDKYENDHHILFSFYIKPSGDIETVFT